MPNPVEIFKPGDIGLVQGKALISKMIRFGQKIEDGELSPFNHAYIFARRDEKRPRAIEDFFCFGDIYESNHRIEKRHISRYLGLPIMVARHRFMDFNAYLKGYKEIENNLGMIYPYPRIALHSIDLVRAWFYRKCFKTTAPFRFSFGSVHGDWPVCSELAGQFILGAGLIGGWEIGERWKGLNPDHLFDVWRKRPDLWEVVFVGTWSN